MKPKLFSGTALLAGAIALSAAAPLQGADRYHSQSDSRSRASTARPATPAPAARPAAPPSRPAPTVRPTPAPRPPTVSRAPTPSRVPTPSRSVTVRPATPTPRPAIPSPSSRYSSGSSATTAAAAAAAAAARARFDHDRGHDHDRDGDRDHHGDFHGRSPGSTTYVRPGVPVAVNPTATGGSGRTYHAQNPAVAAQVWNSRRYTDPSRWSHIDRHTSYRYYPHSHYRMNYANGYRGLGWYYGPPNYTYYYEAPYVNYYSSRSLIPSTLLSLIVGSDYGYQNSLDYEVQRALYDLGYYRGPLDGDIGPMSRLAIANYQADNGLEPTGIIDENLLYYLGIQ